MSLPIKSQRNDIESNDGPFNGIKSNQMLNPENSMLINGFSSIKQRTVGHHSLELLEKTYHQREDYANFAMLKKIQGIHAPLRVMSDRRAIAQTGRLPFLCSSNLHRDVIDGRDDTITMEDILNDPSQCEVMGPPHMMVEKKLGLL